ncbi:MAG: DUF3347 domain-containing protein, partial [Marinirhabdus sp.]
GPQIKTAPPAAGQMPKETPGPILATFTDENKAAIFKNYIAIKTALVNTNAAQASLHASKLIAVLPNTHAEETLLQAAQHIVESNTVETQRAQFVVLTKGVEALLKDAVAQGTIYKQYCPMAFGNSGASWLNESKAIRNPYFGDKMLKCGRIEATIK